MVCASVLAGGCAVSHTDGSLRPTLPKPVSAVYSQVNLKLRLLVARDADKPTPCTGRECFDERVARLAPKIAEAAYALYPEFACQAPDLNFVIVDKVEPSTMSTALGRVVVFRPVEKVAQTDAALAFILAREVGHILAHNHEENAAVGLVVSAVTHLLLPVAAVAKALGELAGPSVSAGTVATATVAANASATGASMAGSTVLVETARRTQQEEADDFGLRIVARLGYDAKHIAQSFGKAEPKTVNDWMAALHKSVDRLSQLPELQPELVNASQNEPQVPACRFEHTPQPLILGML